MCPSTRWRTHRRRRGGQRLFRGGRGAAFDVTRAEAAVDQNATALPTIVAGRQAALYELGALMGRAPADYPKEAETCAAPATLRQLLPIGDGNALIRRRADIREADRALAAATATIGIETAQLYPQVSLGGSLGFGGPLSAIGHGSQFSLSAGPLIAGLSPSAPSPARASRRPARRQKRPRPGSTAR